MRAASRARCRPGGAIRRRAPGAAVGEAAQSHALERRGDGVPCLPAIKAGERRRELEILANGEEGIDRGLLEHEPQSSPGRAARLHHVVTEHGRMSTGGAEQRGQQEHCGRLAGTVGTEQAHQLPGRDPQGEAVQSPRASVVAAESLGRDGGLAHAGCGSLASLR